MGLVGASSRPRHRSRTSGISVSATIAATIHQHIPHSLAVGFRNISSYRWQFFLKALVIMASDADDDAAAVNNNSAKGFSPKTLLQIFTSAHKQLRSMKYCLHYCICTTGCWNVIEEGLKRCKTQMVKQDQIRERPDCILESLMENKLMGEPVPPLVDRPAGWSMWLLFGFLWWSSSTPRKQRNIVQQCAGTTTR